MKCPHCGNEINVGKLIGGLGGQATSRAKTKAARANAKLGGWPKGKKRKKRRPGDANALAYSVVEAAEKITNQAFSEAFPGSNPEDFTWKIHPKIMRQWPPPQRLKVLPSPKSPKRAR